MEEAIQLDQRYPGTLRDEFNIPTFQSMGLPYSDADDGNKSVYYLCGNSLGLMPKNTRNAINAELDAWSERGVESHFRHPREEDGFASWVDIDLPAMPLLAPIVGADIDEIAIMNSLTSNLNALCVAFYKPKGARNKILFEKSAFPSDYFALSNQCRIHDLDPQETLIQLSPRPNETYLRTEDILQTISENKDNIAMVCLSGIQYYTGQFFDIEKITKYAHQYPDIVVGWDLAHAVGNVPLKLHDWGVDFACWCSYKYLNSGPGGIGGLFVHSKHANDVTRPRLAGWWGNNASQRFRMVEIFNPIPGGLGFRQSNPSVIDVVALKSSLELFKRFGGMNSIRDRSLYLTNYLLRLLKASRYYYDVDKVNPEVLGFMIITPVYNDQDHGAQLSLRFYPHHQDNPEHDTMEQVFKYINTRGVIADERRPSVIRLAPAPLYNTFQDVYHAVKFLNEAMDVLSTRTCS
ncbi:hypothetical protein HG535_0F04630 [Zygotorulaspora mrakii]|uniref:Kynureninase n=1 Tax=Zygotorulaspora mrakii TaxID=42260 RepID=A0A7H9B5H5_ZYGMR|nr:uncharacterized protein HG535_0F04630 [Zygotorulaspora mrakii]QLG73951.1 hypothetical protein HG535_0F04630 [Zygotorulaspora mrakii]